jgi:outer membrane protein assembly factor BamB
MRKKVRPRLWIVKVVTVLACGWAGTAGVHGADWPYHRGKGALGVWEETGILEKFPEDGLAARVRWRTPLRSGYTGPAVADGRVFVTDFVYTTRPRGIERALALDETTGRILWTREWEANYSGLSYDRGPRTTPTVDGDRVYVQGSMGAFFCLDVKTGDILWRKDFMTDYHGPREKWSGSYGFVAPPLVDGDRVICKVGGEPNAKVVAFDKRTGKELWRALPSDDGPAYSPLIIINAGHTRQLIVWHDGGVSALDPETGKVYWEYPWRPSASTAVATPVQAGSLLYFTAYYQGSLVLSLDEDKPAAHMLWKSLSESETVTDAIHVMIMTPVIIGDYIYGIDSHGELRCLNLKTGDRIWETQAVTRERALHATAHFIRNGDRVFMNNDFGELIIAKLAPDGYHEISRTQLIKPTTPASQRRTGGLINWTHPAYANKHVITRNDEEIISVSLAADARD